MKRYHALYRILEKIEEAASTADRQRVFELNQIFSEEKTRLASQTGENDIMYLLDITRNKFLNSGWNIFRQDEQKVELENGRRFMSVLSRKIEYDAMLEERLAAESAQAKPE